MLTIELDSLTLQACLPYDRFQHITALLESWVCQCKQHCMRKDLECLIGTLHHTCKVIPQGPTLIWHLINLLSLLTPCGSLYFFSLYYSLYSWAGQCYCWCFILFQLPVFLSSSSTWSSHQKCAIKCSPSFPINSSPAGLSEAFPSCSSTCTSHRFSFLWSDWKVPISLDLAHSCR